MKNILLHYWQFYSNPASVGFLGKTLRAYRDARWHAQYQQNGTSFQIPLSGPMGILP